MGKGSGARPFSVPYDKFAQQFDSIFKPKSAPARGETTGCGCEPGQCREAEARNCRDWTKRNVEDGK